MTTPNVQNLIRVPGRLSHTPTSLATAYPHGGTALGLASVVLRFVEPTFLVTAAEWGGAVVDLIDGGLHPVLDCEIREVTDPDALAIVFPCNAAGAAGGPTLSYVVDSSTHRAGRRLGDTLSRVLVFTPDNADEHPWIILRRAVPALRESVELAMRANTTATLRVLWYATADSNKKAFDWGRRRDLVL